MVLCLLSSVYRLSVSGAEHSAGGTSEIPWGMAETLQCWVSAQPHFYFFFTIIQIQNLYISSTISLHHQRCPSSWRFWCQRYWGKDPRHQLGQEPEKTFPRYRTAPHISTLSYTGNAVIIFFYFRFIPLLNWYICLCRCVSWNAAGCVWICEECAWLGR